MKDKLRDLAERWKNTGLIHAHTCARELLSILDAEGDGGAVGEDMFDTASKVRDYLNRELPDENKHIFGEVLAALTYAQTRPARSGVVSDEDVVEACEYYDTNREEGSHAEFMGMRAALEHFARRAP